MPHTKTRIDLAETFAFRRGLTDEWAEVPRSVEVKALEYRGAGKYDGVHVSVDDWLWGIAWSPIDYKQEAGRCYARLPSDVGCR